MDERHPGNIASSETLNEMDGVRAALSEYDVKCVITATGGRSWREHHLAVTPGGLAILTPRKSRGHRGREFAVRLARWPLVQLGGFGEPQGGPDGSRFDLVVRVGRQSFVALLDGPTGQRTLRDFVVAVQRGMRGDFAYADYDAASMLTF